MVTIRKVETKKMMKKFASFANELYADSPYYVPELEMDTFNMFDRKTNPGLDFTEVQPFLAYKDEKVVGRICGIINHHANQKWNTETVRFGMIDFIDDKEVSEALLNAVEQWGKAKGCSQCQGPLGITDFDKEGMLIEDFDKVGSMIAIYNHPYYPIHMEQCHYEKAVDWLQVRLNVPDEMPERFLRVEKFVQEKFNLHIAHPTRRDVIKGEYGRKLFKLLNTCYEPLFGFCAFTDEQAQAFVDQYMTFLDLRLVTFVENEENELVGLAITMPSMNEALQKSKGKMLPFGWFHLLKAIKFHSSDAVDFLLIAIRPDYQGKGVNTIIFHNLYYAYHALGYKTAETGPQLETNHKELSQWDLFSPEFIKRRRCYTKNI